MKNSKNLRVKALVDSRCIHIEINEQLVKEKRIWMKPINFSFEVFNTNRTKNREMTKIVPLEIEINGHKEQLEAAVIDLNRTDMFLGHMSRSKIMDLNIFYFIFSFHFLFDLVFIFLFLDLWG